MFTMSENILSDIKCQCFAAARIILKTHAFSIKIPKITMVPVLLLDRLKSQNRKTYIIMVESNTNSALSHSTRGKFVPTCEICGQEHWPFDPSCMGKKAVKQNEKKKIKEAKNEKKRKKIDAKNKKLQKNAQNKARPEAITTAKKQNNALLTTETQYQNEVKARIEAEEKARLEADKRIFVETQTQDQIRLYANELTSLNQKLQKTEKALLKEKSAVSKAKQKTAKIKTEFQGITEHQGATAKIRYETNEAIAKEKTAADLAHKWAEKIKYESDTAIAQHYSDIAKINLKADQKVAQATIRAEKSIANAKKKADDKIAKFKTKTQQTIANAANKSDSYANELKQFKIQLKAECKAKEKAESELRKVIKKQTGLETTLKLKEDKIAARIARAKEKTKAETEIKARAQIEKLLITEAQERAKIKLDMEDKVESFAEKMAAIKTESEQAIEKAKLYAHENDTASAMIRQEANDKAKHLEFLDCDGLDAKEDRKRSTANETILPGSVDSLLSVRAHDMMQADIAWCSKEDSVENALKQMQQQDTRYMLVGENGIIEGIVSKSDLKGALSLYLQPQFAKWRRPLDDATLQIRVKWVMSKPVHTIGSETQLITILNEIRQLNVSCFPVIDDNRQVIGVVTKARIFDALVTTSNEKQHQKPSLPPYSLSRV